MKINFDSPKARLHRAKGQKSKGLFKSPGGETHKTKTNIAVDRHDGNRVVAVRRATPPRIAEPGAATTNFSIAITISLNFPSTPISRSFIIVIMINILTEFINIPMHII